MLPGPLKRKATGMRRAIVVGSGAGGATAAKALQGSFQVKVLEAGGTFSPFSWPLPWLEVFKKLGVFLDPREISLFFPAMQVRRTQKMTLVNGRCLGGSTVLSAGNALRLDDELRRIGIDLDEEFAELYREVPVSAQHQDKWRPVTRQLFSQCQSMGLAPFPLPKFGAYQHCVSCGRCIFGCPHGVKWDSRRLLQEAERAGAEVLSRCRVSQVKIKGGKATGVMTNHGFISADVVVLAAGGLGTPVILESSGVACQPRLFVDPVLCLAAHYPGAGQTREYSMPFAVQRENYIMAPYFDYLSFFFQRQWHYPAKDTVSLMIKLADTETGDIKRGNVIKDLTQKDEAQLTEGIALCREILSRCKISPDNMFLGMVNAGHPGGMLPLTGNERQTLQPPALAPNLYLADATLLPRSLGNPQILTIMALSRKVSKKIIENWA